MILKLYYTMEQNKAEGTVQKHDKN